MKKRLLPVLPGLLLCFLTAFPARAGRITVTPAHPRIFLHPGEEADILEKVREDAFLADVHHAILERSDAFLSMPPLERRQIGKRLLSISRSAFKQIFFLSYSYRMTGDERYAERVGQLIRNVCSFSDWNPPHFLDVAEMTAAVAIGYDWCYDALDKECRALAEQAILEKGLRPSMRRGKAGAFNRNWRDRRSNWNAVCNMGMALGAIATFERHPALSRSIIRRAVTSTQTYSLPSYAPDGNYPEGLMYWNYGTGFLVMLSEALESATSATCNLAGNAAFMRSAQYICHMTSQRFGCYAYSDCNAQENSLCLPMFWFASRTGDASLLYGEAGKVEYLKSVGKESKVYTSRYLPCIMLWAEKGCLRDAVPPAQTSFIGQGETPVALLRNHWGGEDEIFVGLKAGSCRSGHAHMDIGSFVMYRGPYQWATDLGNQDYHSLEKFGLNLSDRSQDSDRWIPFRTGMYSHNLMIFNNERQRVDAMAQISRHGDKEDFSFAVSDLTDIQGGLVGSYQRGVAIIDGNYVLVRDEITAAGTGMPLRWAMLTPAEVEITGERTAVLRQEGQEMYLEAEGDDIRLETWSTAPENDFDAPNPGTVMVGFQTWLAAEGKRSFSVRLIPSGRLEGPFPAEKPLADW